MEESAFIGGVVAGIVYFMVGARLIHQSWRSQESPEFLLGMSFFIWGLSYACWQIPIVMANRPLTQPLFFAGRILTHVGTILLATFVWIAFRNRAHWAKYLVFAIAIGLSAGVAGSTAQGDWEGVRPLSNPWWWLDWAAGFVGMSWVGVEGFIEYHRSRRRVQLGLCDPLASNRFLIWGITGVVWTAYSWIFMYQNVEFERTGFWSTAMDSTNGVVETTGVALVWLIFFPPRFYRRWVAGAAPAAKPEEA